jgi:hypothetical protein
MDLTRTVQLIDAPLEGVVPLSRDIFLILPPRVHSE